MKLSRLLLLLAGLLAGTAALALDFGSLTKGLDPRLTKALDTAKDAGKVLKGVTGIGPIEENKIGQASAMEVIAKYGGLVRDDEVMRRVNVVGRAVARYSKRPDVPWRFAVLNSDSMNAFSTPAGYVFITRALYDQAGDDEVLAGVLGHEIAHITDRHALKIIERNEAVGGAASQLMQRSKQTREAASKVAQANAVAGFDLSNMVKTLIVNGFDANTEFAADADGRAATVTAGFAPGGLRAALLQLEARGENRQTMFSTHPPLAERIKRLPDEPASSDAKDQPVGEAK